MKMSIGDVVDRWTIAYLKSTIGGEDCIDEINAYIDHCSQYDQKTVTTAWKELHVHNWDIWKLESDIRKGKEGELGLEEVGRRALAIRDHNKLRVAVVNRLNAYFKEGFQIVKVNHASK